MEQILRGVLASDKPEPLKRALFNMIAEKGKLVQQVGSISEVLNISMHCVIDGKTQVEYEEGLKIYISWARHNRATFEHFFTKEVLLSLLSGQYQNSGALVDLIHESMRILQASPSFMHLSQIIAVKGASFVREHPDAEVVGKFAKFLLEFRNCIPQGEASRPFCETLITALGMLQPPDGAGELQKLPEFVHHVEEVASLLKHIWDNSDTDTIVRCLQTVFRLISCTDEVFGPPFCLASLVEHIPKDMRKTVVKSVVTDPRINDTMMTIALTRMLDWLRWPKSDGVDEWLGSFLQGLASVHKYTILIKITEENIDMVFRLLQFRFARQGVIRVLYSLLLGYQHSPDAFHKIVNDVPTVIAHLGTENSPSSKNCLEQLSHMLHCLMYLHAGFPELYDPVLEAVKGFPRPSSDVIKQRLSEYRWGVQQESTTGVLSKITRKSETGKVGLVNLGNTCYMNSVIQALYMCDGFRQALLSSPADPHCPLLVKMQYLAAFLGHSQRAAFSPTSFLKVSRPQWFIPGHQQDCAEFLHYLLDQLHEQELTALRRKRNPTSPVKLPSPMSSPEHSVEPNFYKSKLRSAQQEQSTRGQQHQREIVIETKDDVDPTLVGQTFGGKVMTTCRCLTCGHESARTESFFDLPLAFPDGNKISSHGSSLVGGKSTPAEKNVEMEQEGNTVGKVEHETGETKMDAAQVKESKLEGLDTLSRSSAGLDNKDGGNDSLTLENLLDYYLEPEKLEGDNKYYCDKCQGLQDGERSIKIVHSPNFLILTLLRFSYNIKTQSRSKLFNEVSYPKTLMLPVHRDELKVKFTTDDPVQSPLKFDQQTHDYAVLDKPQHAFAQQTTTDSGFDDSTALATYALCGVVIHSGASSECGHYYCYARHSLPVTCLVDRMETDQETDQETGNRCDDQDYLQDKWYLFNDSRVTYASFDSFSNVTKRFSRDTAYVLIYKKISSDDSILNLDDSINPAVVDPPLRKDLRDAVIQDNAKYLQEQELEARSQAVRRSLSTSPARSWNRWSDFDDKGGPPGSCGPGGGGGGGGGGFGGIDLSGSRFVY
ncbi:ubiquitin carboxyl-terminal hydrolase 38-like [Lingula anatina]|uniref:Ubiquitin carboxyl-terminal hydrolase 38-like n=1 Tax=Lingula anatina TaxID=7574 RepID=A0A1S3IWC5_LINAN|nr:ubiquitin carboxyl-terminal hydrolase 38-like [Lingula anatina]|eukprot:XP_013402266.1 ubiquitin carboxyl-terminal hydrolase 38-like [Lingula anatina]